jgi:ABC-type Fe3+ transport system permease subunit
LEEFPVLCLAVERANRQERLNTRGRPGQKGRVGTPYIILAAFALRGLPASVRAGVASLQQIDPSCEEASAILGADAQIRPARLQVR